MTAPVYGVTAPANVSVGAAATVSALSAIAPAQFGLEITGLKIGVVGDSDQAADSPITVEICRSTMASAGTSTGAADIGQINGLTIAAGFTGFYDYTVEPTVLTVLDKFTLTPYGGLAIYDVPAGDEYQCGVSQGLILRITAPQAQNVVPSMKVRRI